MNRAIDSSMQQAVRLHQNGKFAEAERVYRDVLGKDPRNADALHLLGLIALSSGHPTRAIELIDQAIFIRPTAEFLVNLGLAHRQMNDNATAERAYREAMRLNPRLAEGSIGLAGLLVETARASEAV